MPKNFEKFPQSSVPLESKLLPRITRIVESGISELGDAVKRDGLVKTFRTAYNHLPQDLRFSLRGLIRAYYPGFGVPFQQQPEPKAIEHGLVMGIKLAQITLEKHDFDRFCEQADLNNVRLIQAHGLREQEERAKDLVDTIQTSGGSTFMSRFGHAFSADILFYDAEGTPEAAHFNRLHQDALGYHGALMQSYVESVYIRQSQPIDVQVRFEILNDAESLEWITEEDVPKFF